MSAELYAELAECERERDVLRAEVERLRANVQGQADYAHWRARAEQMTALARRLATELAALQKRVDDWNESVQAIIGRVPVTGMEPRASDAALREAREAGVLKGEG